MVETKRVNILCVDDTPANLVALEALLSYIDATLVFARSGQEAVARARETEFAVILLDVMMPVMDGFETGQVWEDTFPLRSKTGEWRRFLSRAIPIRNANGEIVRWFGTNTDVEEQLCQSEALAETTRTLERTNRELDQSNKELEQFAAIASHDLKEPLRMISAYVELLAQKLTTHLTPDTLDYINFAVDGTKRMGRLIDDLLEYARIAGTQKQKALPRVRVDEVVELALSNLRTAIKESNARIEHTPFLEVTGDKMQLVQLFQNLIGNGIKYRRPDVPPEVHAGCERKGDNWLFHVKDNGIGFDMQHADCIFDAFRRLHPQGEYSGTGLGLAVCKKIVERHGGRIWAESQMGQGSTFYFTLPATVSTGEDEQ